ncbi:MAG: type II secretion system F family protein [Bacteroidetes bacterium]|jgi:type IV pilus assembly protein PilC|nr:type II secretion system F family protein [Bacteroidota bacterium]
MSRIPTKVEYRVSAQDRAGRALVKYVMATSYMEARSKGREWTSRNGAQLLKVEKKRTFVYKARRGDRLITGTQSAYSRAEVTAALKRIGYQVQSVYTPFSIKFAAPATDIVGFVSQSAKLLEQKLPFNEVLVLMADNIKNKALNQCIRDVMNDLRNGMDSREAFLRQSQVLGFHTALLLGIATKSGDVAAIFRSVAQLVERQAEFSKGLKSALLMPAVTALTLAGAIIFYALFLVPQMMDMLGPMMSEIPPVTAFTLDASAFIKENYTWLTGIILAIVGGFYAWLTTPNGSLQFDRYIVKVPYVGTILKNTSVELFTRVLSIIYTSAGENIEAMQVAADASGNLWFARQIRTVASPMMLTQGVELGRALAATDFLPEMALSRFRTAAETGSVKTTAQNLADYYETENSFAMKNLVSMIELGVTIIIMGSLVFLTLLSSETAGIDVNKVG